MDSREGRIFESAVEQIQEPHQFHRTAEIAENLAGQRVGYTPKQENTLGLAGKRFSPGAVEATEVEGISGKQVEQEEMRKNVLPRRETRTGGESVAGNRGQANCYGEAAS